MRVFDPVFSFRFGGRRLANQKVKNGGQFHGLNVALSPGLGKDFWDVPQKR
jgi:hypothetical protein